MHRCTLHGISHCVWVQHSYFRFRFWYVKESDQTNNKQHQNPQMQGERFEVKLKLKLMNKMLKLPFIKTPKSSCIYLCKCKKRQVNVNSCLSRHKTISYVIWYDSFNALFIFHIPAVSTPSSHHKITPLPFINNGFVGICNK